MIIANRGGHTKASTGANGFINELTENRKVISRVNELLSKYNTIVDCTPNENNGYGEWNIGVNICNNSNAEIFFSIHFNAGGGKGSECIKHSTDAKIVPYANNVLTNLSNLGFVNRGIKNNDELAETANIKVPSMIIEVCFVDTKEDTELYNRIGVETIARAIANGIDKRIALKEDTELYRVRKNWADATTQIGAYKDLNNAKNNCPSGYKVYNSQGVAVYPIEAPKPTEKYLNLLAHVKSWRVYPIDVAPVVGNECAKLAPAQYGGLSYKILEQNGDVKIIQTEMFGKVQIFAPKDEDSSITNTPLY